MLLCELLDQRVTFGAGLLSSWEPVVAVVTVQGHLFLFEVPKPALAAAARRARHPLPSAAAVLVETLLLRDPVEPPLPPSATKATEEASKAKAEAAAKHGPVPPMPAPVKPEASALLANCAIEWAPKASACGCAFEVTEHSPSSWRLLPSMLQLGSTKALTLKAPSPSRCALWVRLLRALARPDKA